VNVAIVTPYYRPDIEWLRHGHQSVQGQQHGCRHFFVADGEPIDLVDEFDAEHIRFSGPNRDHGNTARAIGAIAAARQGFDAVCFLGSIRIMCNRLLSCIWRQVLMSVLHRAVFTISPAIFSAPASKRMVRRPPM